MTRAISLGIVTISYNQSEFVSQCIDSVLSQLGATDSYIIVDAKSTDGTVEILSRYQGHPNVEIIVEADMGPADGLNKGFARLKTEYALYINADDYLLDGALDSVRAHIATHKEDMFLFSGYREQDGSRTFIRQDIGSRLAYLCNASVFLQQGHVFRKSCFDEVGGFNTENMTCWDREFFADTLYTGATNTCVDIPLGVFRLQRDSLSMSTDPNAHSRYLADVGRIGHKHIGALYQLAPLLRLIFVAWRKLFPQLPTRSL